jgi:hypothetical protein
LLPLPCLPEWARRVVAQPYARRQLALAASNGAEHAALWRDPATYRLPDFGAARATAISASRPSLFDVPSGRAILRIHATLLVREQAALIREARAAFATGQPVPSRESVVVPSLRWELTADPEQRTLAMRLSKPPEWLADPTLHVRNDFWVLPLDGTIAWQFAPLDGSSVAAD